MMLSDERVISRILEKGLSISVYYTGTCMLVMNQFYL